jgi:hypothetical protein
MKKIPGYAADCEWYILKIYKLSSAVRFKDDGNWTEIVRFVGKEDE